MSRYTELQDEFNEHNNAASQRPAIEQFVMDFANALIVYLECPPASIKYTGKEGATVNTPREALQLSANKVWTIEIRIMPNPGGAKSVGWDVGLGIRKKWDSFIARTWIGGAAGTGAKPWKFAAAAAAASINEMCEWVYTQIKAFYRDYDYFRR